MYIWSNKMCKPHEFVVCKENQGSMSAHKMKLLKTVMVFLAHYSSARFQLGGSSAASPLGSSGVCHPAPWGQDEVSAGSFPNGLRSQEDKRGSCKISAQGSHLATQLIISWSKEIMGQDQIQEDEGVKSISQWKR